VANDSDPTDDRPSRYDAMIEEFRAAQKRRLVKQGMALWNRTEAAQRAGASAEPPSSEKN
jgi:hypothetical protein